MGANRLKTLHYSMKRRKNTSHLVTLAFLLWASCCHGDEQSANHLLLFDTLPDGISSHKAAPFDVRTNFSGTVHLAESRDFRAVVNITAPSLQEAYDVQADLFTHRGRLVLEIKQQSVADGILSLTWLLIGMGCATACVGVCTIVYVVRWYEQERQPYELVDHRSFASSSQRGGVYRPGNCIPMVHLGGPGGGVGAGGFIRGGGGGEDGNLRCEEELRQVQELPEEEEAEAREMEKHQKLKLMKKEELALASAPDSTSGDTTQDSDNPHERNLIMSRFNSQAKTLHKDLLSTTKKASSPSSSASNLGITVGGGGGGGVGSLGRRMLAVRRTQDGTYEGVPAADPDDPEESKGTADSSVTSDEEEKSHSTGKRGGSRGRYDPPPNYAAATAGDVTSGGSRGSPALASDLRVKLESGRDGKLASFTGGLSKSADASSEPKYANDPSERDPLLILADVHKTTSDTPEDKPSLAGISNSKDNRPGNVYVNPAQMKRTAPPKLTSFGAPPAVTSTPKPRAPAKGERLADQDPWVLNSMSDIAEDPREDDQSVVSGSGRSGKSNSMYGSSEIFDSGEYRAMGPGGLADFYDSLLDSDVEVPPLDAEDGALLSDGGLPSPLGFPALRAGEKGKVNDDIKLIPGALKSPGAHVGHQVGASTRPRPYSSFIYRPSLPLSPVTPKPTTLTESQSATSGNSKAEESPPLPPLPPYPVVGGAIASIDDESQSASSAADTSVFQFPPPPSLCQPEPSNRNSGRAGLGGGEYVQIKVAKPGSSKSDQSATASQGGGRGRGGGGRGGRKLFGGGTYMNVAILSTLCLLTVAGGAYSSFLDRPDQTRVDVTIFAPRHFLGNLTRMFLNYHLDTEVMDAVTDHKIRVFDVEHPLIDPKTRSDACANMSCDHACDEATGLCACRKGYKSQGLFHCIDVNECMEGKVRCDLAAGCHNRKGTYNCICGEDFYGNGKTCRECNRPCPDKHYEVQPCAPEVQKICKECTQTCRPGYFMAQQCTTNENAICRVCSPECEAGEFESRQCSTHHDRECMNATLLQQPVTSQNLIIEDRSHVVDIDTKLDKVPATYVGFSNYQLKRVLTGTTLILDITVRFIDAAQHFIPVNESGALNFDLDLMAPSDLRSYAVKRFCPYPLPDYYTLRHRKHENITYKQNPDGSIEPCVTSSNGNVGGAIFRHNQPASFSCAQPGGLTDIFSVDENFFLARTKYVATSKRCQRQSEACKQCTHSCSTNMNSPDAKSTCEINGHDDENGESPRLMMCYNCCVKRDCSSQCRDYRMSKCQPKECTKGNLLEFSLEPSWDSSQEGRFFCHIRPRPQQYLLNLDYRIRVERKGHDNEGKKKGRGRGRGGARGRGRSRNKNKNLELHKTSIRLYGDDDWLKTGAMKYSDGILDISINSSLGHPPDLLEGDIHGQGKIFRVGDYKSKGRRFGNSYIREDNAILRPPTPHGTPVMPQAHQECSVPKLADMLFTSNMENPYIRRAELEAYSDNASLPFTVKNLDTPPIVRATVDRATPILQKLFPPVRLREESFRGDVTHNGSHWMVEIAGEVDVCPGFIRIKLSDPARASVPLFDCDTAVRCPSEFNLTFALPTSDLEGMYKDVLVQVKDKRHLHNFRLFRRTSLEEEEEEADIAKELTSLRAQPTHDPTAQAMRQSASGRDGAGSDPSGSQADASETPNLPLPIYALLVIAGGILLLLVLAIIGQCFLADFPIPDTPYAQVHHALFAVCYMLMQFVYSVFISGTAFFLILTIITSRDVNFIVRHGQPGAVSTAASNIELLRLQRHLEGEITRQDSLADAAQEMCIRDVYKISQDMRQLHDALLNTTQDVFEKHRLDLLLTQQKIHVRQKLSKDLNKFRESYAKAARAVLNQVNQKAQASYLNLENNAWLGGAGFLRDIVVSYRKLKGKSTKPFMEWTGIQVELEKLQIDLSFSLPALPRLDDIPAPPPDKQPVKRDSGPQFPELEPIRSIQMHNNWFFPVEEMGIGGAASFISLDHEETRPDTTPQSATSAAFYVFLVLLSLCDIVLLGHRMCRSWTTAKLCVYGFPEYFRENKEAEMGNDDVFASRESKLTPAQGCKDSPAYQSVALFFTQTISTTFFPKIVGAIATCVVMVCVLQLSNQYLTVQELERAGLYHSAEQYLDLQTSLTNARLSGHAAHINTLHFPAFQASVSGHLARHQAVLSVYRKQLLGLQALSMEMYCQHLKAIDMQAECSHLRDTPLPGSDDAHGGEAWHKMATLVHACQFYPVVPRLYVRGDATQNPTSAAQIEAVLESLRHIIFLTARLVTIFLVTVVVKELLCAVAWIFLQRSGAMRIRVIVERDQDEGLQ